MQTEDSPERLTVSFKIYEDSMKRKASALKKAQRDLAATQRQVGKLQTCQVARLEAGQMTVTPLQSRQCAGPAMLTHHAAVPIDLYALTTYRQDTKTTKSVRDRSKAARRLTSSDEASLNIAALGKDMQAYRLVCHTTCRKRLDWRCAGYEVLPFLKRDTVTMAKKKYQMCVLQDYLEIFHRKFLAENPDKKVSFSYFKGSVRGTDSSNWSGTKS